MKTFTHDEIRDLAKDEGGSHVTVTMPVAPIADQWRADPVRFGNLLDRARRLLCDGGMRPPDADAFLAGARAYVDRLDFWHQGGRGLVAFVKDGRVTIHRVPVPLPERVIASESFAVASLFDALDEDRFYVLAMSQDHVRLLKCTRYTVERVPVANLPTSWPEAIERAGVDVHEGVLGKTPGVGELFEQVEHALRPVLAGHTEPLVFAGIDRNLAEFRRYTSYANVVDEGLGGNPAFETDEQLRDRALELVDARKPDGAADVDRFFLRLDRALASTNLAEVVPAVDQGRVDTVFVARGVECYGSFDRANGTVELHSEPRPGDVDLVGEVVRLGVLRGASVHAVAPEELPQRGDGVVVNATLRW